MVALSINGTVLDSHGRVNKSVRESLQYVQNKGIEVAFVTSLPYTYVKKITKALKTKAKIISHYGTYISSGDAKPIYVRRIPEDITVDILTLLESFPCHIKVVNEHTSISSQIENQKQLKSRAIFSPGDRTAYQVRFVENLIEAVQHEETAPLHIDVHFNDHDDLLDAQKALKGMFDEIDFEIQPHNQLVILPEGVSTLKSFHYLADHLGVKMSETVGIGYSMDDVEWLETCGLIVAMGDSPKQLRDRADWITRSVEENGVAYMVMEHFRKQQPIEFLKKMNIID